MNATIPFIEIKFKEFNDTIFGGKLPAPAFKLSSATTFIGQCAFQKQRLFGGEFEYKDFCIKLSTQYDLSEEELEDVLIHEMIHYYIHLNHLKDTSAHGKLFKAMMADINTKFHRNIRIRANVVRKRPFL